MGHHRFSKINIQVNGKVKAEAAATAAKPPEPNENDVRAKVKAALENLDIGGGYELVDVEIKKYDKTPDNA